MNKIFENRFEQLLENHSSLVKQSNTPILPGNGVYEKYENPVVTHEHIPLFWRYDLNPETNPGLLERQGINATLNPGAIYFDGRYCLVVRVEGADRKSFFAIAESSNGVDNFKFRDFPILLEETERKDVNIYDMRLTQHEDGWIYGVFCTERKDASAPESDTSSAEAQCGIVRTKDLMSWERLEDLKTPSPQQRNCVLHPEFVDGKYAFYTRPQDGFIECGKGGGLGWGLSASIEKAEILEEIIVDEKIYHTIKEVKNGGGCVPIKTDDGWVHIVHGVRGCASGLRYVIYAFMTELERPWVVTHRPAGALIVPEGEERVGDVSNVVFTNGAIVRDEEVHLYYASSDTRCHVAKTSLSQLLDYCKNTPEDALYTRDCTENRIALIEANLENAKSYVERCRL